MLHEQGIMRVAEHMPRMARGDIWEEVVTIAEQDAGGESGQEAVEEDLRDLRHAGDGFPAKVAQVRLRPGRLVRCCEGGTVRRRGEEVEHKLGVCFDTRNAAGGEEGVEIIVHSMRV